MMVAFKMSLLIFALLSITSASDLTKACNYTAFHEYHSACNETKPQCNIISGNFTAYEKAIIVSLHNRIRNETAGAVDKRLPEAANMMEMEWDPQLAKVAQKWADQHKFEHDNDTSRSVGRYERVGQILYLKGPYNFTKGKEQVDEAEQEMNIRDAMDFLTKNKEDFSEQWVDKYEAGESYDAFTQIVWAHSWRVGCGKVYWKDEEGQKFMLVCNYGLTGNEVGKPVYKRGKPGNACPVNTCFGKSECEMKEQEHLFSNLCKAIHISKPPIFNITKSRLHGKGKTDDYHPHDYGYDYDNLPYDYGYDDGYLPHDYGSDEYLPHDYGSRDDYHYGYNY